MIRFGLPFIGLLLAIAASPALGGEQDLANKAVARRVFDDLYNRRDFAAARDIYAPDFVNHGVKRDVSLAEDQAALRGWCDAFPDLHIDVNKEIAEGDLVTVLWTGEGTNTGAGNGLPATGRHAQLRGITIWRVVNGKLSEEWSAFDELGPFKELGLVTMAK
jgi:steroid delta-isomerase-like uncharacterized protein